MYSFNLPLFPYSRPRRSRRTPALRQLVAEHQLHATDLIAPLFVHALDIPRKPILTLPGHYRLSLEALVEESKALLKLGVKAVAPFPAVPASLKHPFGEEAYNPEGLLQKSIRTLKQELPELCVIADIALDPYTTHGHDGIIDPKTGDVLNDDTLTVLSQQALSLAEAGADVLAPSDMMDGRIRCIRDALEKSHYHHVILLSHTAKYASDYYGPFREAIGSDHALGRRDKKGYQLDLANAEEAIREAWLDVNEGADWLMVKPGLFYLDILYRLHQIFPLPLFSYQVSGEYAMIQGAITQGWLPADKGILESLVAFKRAGATGIFTYFAKQAAELLAENSLN